MNILLVDLGQELRGGQMQVYYLARALVQSEEAMPLVACPRGSALEIFLQTEKIPCLALPGRNALNPAVLFVVSRAIRKHHIDIIHTNDAQSALLGAFFKKTLGDSIKLVHTRRVSYPLGGKIHQTKYMIADAIVGVSATISEGLEKSGVPHTKVSTIHSGIDLLRYRAKECREDERINFLTIGALTPQKGYPVLIQAMSVLREMEDLPPWEVRIVGEGSLFNQILDQARELKVDSHLSLLGRQESRIILPLCDVLVVPSVDGEGSSATIKEGWVTGLPVICSALPSNMELVHDKKDGLVTAVGNPLALAAAMCRCMLEPQLRIRLRQAAYQQVQNYTYQRMADAYVHLYKQFFL